MAIAHTAPSPAAAGPAQPAPRPLTVDEVVRMAEAGIIAEGEPVVRDDLGGKALADARWGAPVYWVLDLAGRRLLVHSQPEPDGDRRITPLAAGEAAVLPRVGVSVPVAALLPPA